MSSHETAALEARITHDVVESLAGRFPQESRARIRAVVDGCVTGLHGISVSAASAAAADDYARAVAHLATSRLSFGTAHAPHPLH